MSTDLNVTILGCGNAVHVLAGLLPSTGCFKEVNICSTFADEAERSVGGQTVSKNGSSSK